MTSQTVFNPTCSLCHGRMGDMSGEEFEALVLAEGLQAKCFDCSPGEADKLWTELWPCDLAGTLVIDGQMFWMSMNCNGVPRIRSKSITRVGAGERACLSSYTYLNTFPNQPVNGKGINVNNARCPVCGFEPIADMGEKLYCPSCGESGRDVSDLILPDWILKTEWGFSRKPDSANCPDCAKVRAIRNGEGLCDYHQNLYELTFDGDILGWNNG